MIRTISIREPWLHCILHLGKRIENRVWSTSYRGPVLLHRAKALSKREHRDALAWISEHVSPDVAARVPSYSEMRLVDRGAIVGIADRVASVAVIRLAGARIRDLLTGPPEDA